ncbi:MAG: SdrD B-like domain-containing protein [Stenotrophomonas sp.]
MGAVPSQLNIIVQAGKRQWGRWGLLAAMWMVIPATHAAVLANSVSTAADIGIGQDVDVEITWTRTGGSSGDTISVEIPAQLVVDPPSPPSGCTYTAPNMVCAVPAGSTGTITFPVRGKTTGGFNLVATGTAMPAASVSGNVRAAGDLTVGKVLTLPATGNPLAGGLSAFELSPNLATGANAVPAGATVVVTDTFPGNAASGFNMTQNATFSGLTPACTSFSAANTARKLVCTYTGPFTVAQLNASRITVTGRTSATGSFVNTASIGVGSNLYLDINNGNNTATLPYSTDAATDLGVTINTSIGGSAGTASPGNSSQTVTLRVDNHGPLSAPVGAVVETVVPSDFILGTLPTGCTAAAGSLTIAAPVAGSTQTGTWSGTRVTCAVGALAVGNNGQFVLPVTLPNTLLSGLYLPAVVTPAAGEKDGVQENNKATVRYWVAVSAADLGLTKSKSPSPVAPGGTVTTTLRVTNRGPEIAQFGGSYGPLRVVDYLDPREIVDGAIGTPSGGWNCTVTAGVAAPAGYPGRTTQVLCELPGPGALPVSQHREVSFSHIVADAATLGPNPVALTNFACTGSEALRLLGLAEADGPFPADPDGGEGGTDRQDCRTATGQATTVITGDAQVSIRKESSVNGTDWFNDVASAPTLLAADNDMHWRMTITTPSVTDNPAQKTIPTLELRDTFHGLVRATGAAPSYLTPDLTFTTSPSTYGSCAATVPGSPTAGGSNVNSGNTGEQVCTFSNVPAGATITVVATLKRPLGVTAANGWLDNEAKLGSPNAFLSASAGGQLTDSARVIVEKRADVALTSKTVTTSIPASGGRNPVASVGETVVFVIAARNQGQDPIAAGNFVVEDSLFTGAATALKPAFEVLDVVAANPAKMSCAASNLASGALSCVNTQSIDRHETQSITVRARVKRPPVVNGVLGDKLYENVTNTAQVSLRNMCEYRADGVADSTACGDANAKANNTASAVFDVTVPSFDLQQGKVAVFPAGRSEFLAGDDLRYRFSIRNAGPSIAEQIVMTDRLTVPPGFTVALLGGAPENMNAVAASTGYTLAAKAVSCTQAAANANVVCTLDALDVNQEVNFELALRPTGVSDVPAIFGNSVNVCANETNSYESSGKCDPDPANAGNNLAGVNNVLFPKTDLEVVSKTATVAQVDIGQVVPYAIVLRNNGASTTKQMRLVDTLPAGFEWLSATAPSVASPTGGATLTAPAGTLTVLAAPPASPDAANVCYVSNGISSVTTPAQRQQITCHINGNFPAGGAFTLSLSARPKTGVFAGPYVANIDNRAEVFPGKDASNEDLAKDDNPGNNDKEGPVQVKTGASLGGRVFYDQNDNGDQNLPGDTGIAGVQVTLSGTDHDGNPVSLTATTDSSGDYRFAHLPPSDANGYTLIQDQTSAALASYTGNGVPQPNTPRAVRNGSSTGVSGTWTVNNSATESVIGGVVLGSGGEGVQFDFPEYRGVSLAGFVFADRTRNDSYNPASTDTPIEGATVELLVWDAGVGGYVPVAGGTTLTRADGSYQFTGLSPSQTYALRQLLPAGYLNLPSAVKPGLIGGVACAPGVCIAQTAQPGDPVDSDRIIGIQLSADGTNFNFGETVPVSVSGIVFFDVDNDGTQNNPADVGIGNVDIVLNGTDDLGAAVNLSTQTAADGSFAFTGLRPGTYTVTEPTQPVGTINGITTAGTVAGVSSGTATAVATTPSAVTAIDLTVPGSASLANLFAEIPRNSGITGKVWFDSNNDGVVDPTENGIGGVTVELEGTAIDGTPIAVTVITDPDGNYHFPDLPPGTYTVTEPTQPLGTHDGKTVAGTTGGTPTAQGTSPSKITAIVLGGNETSRDNNFGEIPVGSISGYVYNDSNDDGTKQAGEGGYANVTIVLTGTDDLGNPVSMSVNTGADGSYMFKDLRPGTYTVTEPSQPADTLNGLTTAGSIDGVSILATVTDRSTTPSAISSIVLKPGDSAVDNNFGEIGDSPDMLVSKSSSSVKFTVNNVATYTIRVRNGGQKPSFGEYQVKDRLPVGLTLAEIPAGNGWTCSGAVGDARFECRSSEVVNAGANSASDITVKVNVSAEAAKAGTVNNAVLIEGGGENEFRTPTSTERDTFEGDVGNLPVCDVAITRNVCRVPNETQLSSSVGGTVWFDIGSDDALLDGGDQRLHSWIVELVDPESGAVIKTTTTAADGSYRFGDVIPGTKWHIQFREPTAGVIWAWPVSQETTTGHGVGCDVDSALANGHASTCRANHNGTSVLQVVLKAGDHLPQQSLPVDPSGVVYDATTRDPVPGSIVTLTPIGMCNGYDPLTAVLNVAAGGYTVEGNAISMTVGSNGYYQFVFGPAAPARCEFQLAVTPPAGYQFVSAMIPPQGGSLSPTGAVGSHHSVQPQATAPSGPVGTATQYWLTLFSGSATAGIVHNHLPLDTAEATGLVISKTGDRQTAEIGDTVQYTITVRQTAGSALATVNIVDTLPRGFTYIDGTGRIGGRAVEDPLGKPGPRLGFDLGGIDVGGQLVLTYRARVGVGAQQGDGVNRAQAHGCSIAGGCIDPVSLSPLPGSVPSNRAEYRVRVTGGVFTEEACVLGKVFVDCNNNHVQDSEELGIPGVRLYFSNGTWVISDSEGKYSYCGLPPQSHTLKVDASTLPVGARLTTSSNRNLGDADSLLLDLKKGELHRADFIEGSCSNPLLEQVKARRTQGEVRAPETETGQSPLRFENKPVRAPQQATDSANQRPIVHPRPNPPSAAASQEVQP